MLWINEQPRNTVLPMKSISASTPIYVLLFTAGGHSCIGKVFGCGEFKIRDYNHKSISFKKKKNKESKIRSITIFRGVIKCADAFFVFCVFQADVLLSEASEETTNRLLR